MNRFILIALLSTIVILMIIGEKVPVNEGTYGDGLFYREVATSFLDQIEGGSYNMQQLQRILPFALLNIIYTLFDFDMDPLPLMHGMLILQLVFLGLAVYWYFSLSDKLRLSPALDILGFVLLFGNFAILKATWYHPFSPDMTAFAIGMAQANYFIRSDKQKLWLVSIIGSFVWPTLLMVGALLALFPKDKMDVYENQRPKSLFPVMASAVIFGLLIFVSWFTDRFISADHWKDLAFHKMSIIFMVGFVFLLFLKNPVDWSKSWRRFQRQNQVKVLGIVVGILMAYSFILFLLSGSNDNFIVVDWFKSYFSAALRYPLDFVLAHSFYFGLLFVLGLVFFPRMVREMANLGLGFTLVAMLILVLSLQAQSRILMPVIPFIGLLFLKAIKRYQLEKKDLTILVTVNLIISLFWFSINIPGLKEVFLPTDPNELFAWPAQRYWMHFGHLMAFEVYLIGGVILTFFTYQAWKGKLKYRRMSKVSKNFTFEK